VNALTLLERRLQRNDMVQIFTLCMAALVFVLTSRWPTVGAPSNEAWFALAQARLVLLALLALGYGGSYASRPGRQRAITGLAVLSFTLLTVPLDLIAYSGSYPATPLWWTLVLPPIDTVAFFGIGLALGTTLRLIRLSALLPVAVPGLIVAFIGLDVRLGVNLINPMTSSVTVAPYHLALMSVLALTTAVLLLRSYVRDRS
jgi:hypothetical protein